LAVRKISHNKLCLLSLQVMFSNGGGKIHYNKLCATQNKSFVNNKTLVIFLLGRFESRKKLLIRMVCSFSGYKIMVLYYVKNLRF
jgi:hypothetical protein